MGNEIHIHFPIKTLSGTLANVRVRTQRVSFPSQYNTNTGKFFPVDTKEDDDDHLQKLLVLTKMTSSSSLQNNKLAHII